MGCATTELVPSGGTVGSLGLRYVPSGPRLGTLPSPGSTAFTVPDLSLLELRSGSGMIRFLGSVERISSSDDVDSTWYLLIAPYLSRTGDLDLSLVEDRNDRVGRLRDDDTVIFVLSRQGGSFRFSTNFGAAMAQSAMSMLLTSVVSVESPFSRTFLFASSSELDGNRFSPLVFRLFTSSGARLSEGFRFTGRMVC